MRLNSSKPLRLEDVVAKTFAAATASILLSCDAIIRVARVLLLRQQRPKLRSNRHLTFPFNYAKGLALMCSLNDRAQGFGPLVSIAILTTVPTRKNRNNIAGSVQLIERRIYLIRGHKVMIEVDLANLYEVPTKRLSE